MPDYVTRFAPSPTGYLHLGHVASAFHVWDAARQAGGRVLLRIEDIDQTRCNPDYTDAILEDLAWLGFEWDEPVRIQSEHFADYDRVVEHLTGLGLTYRCFRSRKDIAEAQINAGLPPDSPFTATPLPAKQEAEQLETGAPFTWRLSLARCREYLGPLYHQLSFETAAPDGRRDVIKARPDLHGDINLTRKDAPTTYHVACCHDDELQGITHVVRGDDLAEAAHIHVMFQALMGWRQPVYSHHPLVIGADGKRLSKSHASKSLASLRAEGLTPEDIRRLAGV